MEEFIQPVPKPPATDFRELCPDAKSFVRDPKGFFFTQAVKSDVATRLLKKLEEQSASGQLDQLCHHEEDWTTLGLQEPGTMIH